jgi:hypothetical protein
MAMKNFPYLVGVERARLQDHNWATAFFSWAYSELHITERAVAGNLKNKRLSRALCDQRAAIAEQLENWEPPLRAN